jgi:hypothetical protein
MTRNTVGLVAAVLWIAAILGIAACNYTDGQCYRREDVEGPGSDGAGGGPIVPGWGGYGDVPPTPQDADDPQPVDCDLEPKPDKGDEGNKGNDSGSCGDGSATVAEGTYTYCGGPCAAKCPTGGVSGFSPSVFKFTTTVPDDGEGKAGGWQEATGTLNFFRWTSLLPETWSCTITVQMPLRTEVNGMVSAQTAASVTAGVASQASFTVMGIKPELPPGIFCYKFKEEMRSLFKKPPLDTYGARVP